MSADHPFFPPVAESIGPFAQRSFLDAAMAAGDPEAEMIVRESDTGIVVFQKLGKVLSLAGHEDIVDYRSPRGSGAGLLISSQVGGLAADETFSFDSLPKAATDVFCSALDETGRPYSVEEHTTAAVLDLPDSFDAYLAVLAKKERHELRRKRRRYEAAVGEVRFKRETESGRLFEQFVHFHRMSPGSKGSFMTEEMEAFFKSLIALPGWSTDALVDGDGEMMAAGFGYFDETGYYLYNSTYDPSHGEISPGVVLLGVLIELNIERRSPVFDFLKGDEHYKYRLGAHARSLYRVSSTS